ncbi:MAG: CDP-alcohol phosphatidyltransferase family protein [Ignavibacteria bacterium]|nr:CDP-alcohol phosphatidyltransferase family protein [Ignavibacteria bacterium]
MAEKFDYEKTLKTPADNQFLNLQSFLFITSKQLTSFFFRAGVHPHQVILLSMLFGLAASLLIVQQNFFAVLIGVFLLFYKNVLDKVDGSLARAKGVDSRRGRFYDSISDFVVTLASFTAIADSLYRQYPSVWMIAAVYAAMISSMLQCSYFIFYQVSFIKLTGKNTVNRLIESVTEEDIHRQDGFTTLLQRIFQLIYGWQDKLFFEINRVLFARFSNTNTGKVHSSEKIDAAWYGNKSFLTMASSLSIGTHIFLICFAALMRRFDYYIFVNLICMNLLLLLSVIFHYKSSKKQLISAV